MCFSSSLLEVLALSPFVLLSLPALLAEELELPYVLRDNPIRRGNDMDGFDSVLVAASFIIISMDDIVMNIGFIFFR